MLASGVWTEDQNVFLLGSFEDDSDVLVVRDLKRVLSEVPEKLRENHLAPLKITVTGCRISIRGFGGADVCNCTEEDSTSMDFALYGLDDALLIARKTFRSGFEGHSAIVRAELTPQESRYVLRALTSDVTGGCESSPFSSVNFKVTIETSLSNGRREARIDGNQLSKVVDEIFGNFLGNPRNSCLTEMLTIKRILKKMLVGPERSCIRLNDDFDRGFAEFRN